MHYLLTLPFYFLLLMLTGCIVHEKQFVSNVEFKDTNVHSKSYGHVYEEYFGAISFSIDDDQPLSLKKECGKNTYLGASVFLVIPIPTFDRGIAHDSISQETFSLTLKHKITFNAEDVRDAKWLSQSIMDLLELKRNLLNYGDLSKAKVSIELNSKIYPLIYTKGSWQGDTYLYVSDLQCEALKDAILHIDIAPSFSVSFLLNFYEKIEHSFDYFSSKDITFK